MPAQMRRIRPFRRDARWDVPATRLAAAAVVAHDALESVAGWHTPLSWRPPCLSTCADRDQAPTHSSGRRDPHTQPSSHCCDTPCRPRPRRPPTRRPPRHPPLRSTSRPSSWCRRRRRPARSPPRWRPSPDPPRAPVCARCVRPSFIFVIFASGSGLVQSSFDPFFFRFRSNRASSARSRDARRLREPRQPRLVRVARVPTHDASHRRVGFERRRVDPNRPSTRWASARREHRLVRLDVDQPARARQGRMVRRRLVQRKVRTAGCSANHASPSPSLQNSRAAATALFGRSAVATHILACRSRVPFLPIAIHWSIRTETAG